MDASDWDSLDARDMLSLVPEISPRKLRLFTCAFVRRLPSARHGSSVAALEVAERFADGRATPLELASARFGGRFVPGHAAWAVCWPPHHDAWAMTERALAWAAGFVAAGAHFVTYRREARAQADLFREIAGNPFRPVRVDPAWLAWNDRTVPRLAQSLYDARDFGQMPILGDALEEAGCSDEVILGHCRRPREHVRGCWLLDLLLGLK